SITAPRMALPKSKLGFGPTGFGVWAESASAPKRHSPSTKLTTSRLNSIRYSSYTKKRPASPVGPPAVTPQVVSGAAENAPLLEAGRGSRTARVHRHGARALVEPQLRQLQSVVVVVPEVADEVVVEQRNPVPSRACPGHRIRRRAGVEVEQILGH